MAAEFFRTQDRLSLSTVGWLGQLLQAMYGAEEFIDKFHFREARGRHEALHMAMRPPAALISKYKLWRDLSNLVNKMQEFFQDQCLTGKEEAKGKTRKEPAGSSSPARVPEQDEKLARLTRLWDWQASMNMLWQKEKEKIKESIGRKETSPGILGCTLIWGEQGVGKTFVTRCVYREAMYLGYECCVWVRLSASMDIQELLFEITKQMGKLAREVKDMNLQEMTEMHPIELARGKKFLIVLDGVHPSNVQLLPRLVSVLYHGRGHIIITTQDRIVLNMSFFEERRIELKKLESKQSRKMLAGKLHRVPDGQSLSHEEGLIETCQGLPLRISLLSGLLPNAGEQERAALAKDGSKMSLLDLLQLSYHKLPAHLKPCFIYMVLFPRASPVPTRRLVRLWLAEGLLDPHCYDGERKPTRTPEDVGETFVLELAERNVIEVVSWRADGFPKTCHMLNSLYDMIRPIAVGTGLLHVHATSKSKDENDHHPTGQQQQLLAQPRETKVRWLAEHTNIVRDSRRGSYPGLNLRHIRSFLSFYMRRGMVTKDISMFLRNMTSKTAYNLLRVLDLEGVYRPSLQGVLHKLVLLKYLGLRSTALHSIPSAVADLQYLETFDIKNTYITSLPNSFWKSRNLRHLHLNWFYINWKTILKGGSNNVMALTKLQTLSGLVIGEVKEDSMTVHMDNLTTLKLFLHQLNRDTSGTAGEAVAAWISSRLTNLQSLTFGHHGLSTLYLLGQLKEPVWTELFPVSLRVLTLSGSRVEADMMAELGALLKQLRTFRLLANSFLGTSLRFAEKGFLSLRTLKIWKLPNLRELIIEGGAMPQLKELELRHLDAMKNVQGIKECQKLENICVISESEALVEQLTVQEKTNLHFERETKRSGSTDDDEDDRYGTILNLKHVLYAQRCKCFYRSIVSIITYY
ncbi:hypothetical protein BT93_J1610 [Corymbia citriodora subsp. variegata]|nr:hypothetical protein BT93_J1610 [Corymbia citriodora subsp. variegata]